MQNGHIELLPEVLFDLSLETVEDGVAKRTWCHHRLCAARLRGQNVLAGQLDRHPFVVSRSVKSTTLVTPGIIDRLAAENFRKLFQRRIVAGIDKSLLRRGSRDVTPVEGPDPQICQRIDDQLAQALLANIFVQHPEKVADASVAATMQALFGKPNIDGPRKFGISHESRLGVKNVQRTSVADCHQR
jgi:hypothetical protein